MTDIYLDLEWSRKLKEAGIEGNGHQFWIRTTTLRWKLYRYYDGWFIQVNGGHSFEREYAETQIDVIIIPTYSLEELLAMVEGAFWLVNYDLYEIRLEWGAFSNADPKIAVAEALLWQKGEGR
jgi:hypothetical protein